MPFGNYYSVPFWDFIRSMDRPGAGVDQPAFSFQHYGGPPPAFAFGFGGPGHHGFGGPGAWRRGRGPAGRHCHCRRPEEPQEPEQPPNGEQPGEQSGEQPGEPGNAPRGENPETYAPGPHHGGPRHWGRRHGLGGRHWGPPPPPPYGGPGGAPFDMSALINAFASHPIAQALRDYAEQAGAGADGEDAENTFTPPIDIFSTPVAYILHVALPGAKKEDVGVNWDVEKNELNVAGVVYRQGDEEFLKTLSKKERKVGVFERSVKLPPGEEEKEEVDGDNITAKLEDGVLIVTVPKVEKDWTEVKKVDIE